MSAADVPKVSAAITWPFLSMAKVTRGFLSILQ